MRNDVGLTKGRPGEDWLMLNVNSDLKFSH